MPKMRMASGFRLSYISRYSPMAINILSIPVKACRPIVLALLSLAAVVVFAQSAGSLGRRLAGVAVDKINSEGDRCLEEGKVDSAMAYYMVAAGRYDSAMDKDDKFSCVDALNNIGAIKFFLHHDYIQAFSYLTKGLEISEETGYDKIKAKIYVNLAGVHTIFGDSAVAARLMSEAFRISKEQHDWYIYTAAFIDLANHLAVNDNLAGMKDEADDFSSTSIPDSIKMKNYALWLCRGVKLYQQGRYDDCLKALKSAAGHVKPDLQEKICLHIVDMLAAKAYAAKGMYGMAVKRLKSNMTADIPIYSLYNSYKALSAFYAKMGAADSSEAYRVKYLLINDTTLSYSDYMRIRDHECRFLPARVMGELDTSGASGISGGLIAVLLAFVSASAAGTMIWLRSRSRRKAKAGGRPTAGRATSVRHSGGVQQTTEPDEKTQELARMIRQFMETSAEIYQQDFSLEKMAAMLGIHTRTASRVINEVFGINFSTLLSQYRIEEACRRLSSPEYANVTIQAVAVDIGFRSRSNFAMVFKKFTGVSPNEYQKEAFGKKASD